MYFTPPRNTLSDAIFHQLREIELRVQREINERRQELLAKEESLRYCHSRCNLILACLQISIGTWKAGWLRKALQTSSSRTLHLGWSLVFKMVLEFYDTPLWTRYSLDLSCYL